MDQNLLATSKKTLHNAIKTCKEKNKLSQTLSHAVITLIPKGNKCQTVLGNWRPISLPSGFYKIISSAIAHTLKEALPKIIHPSQKAYMQGRFIGEAVRSIYDVQYYSVKHCVPLTVVLVDFSKAFDMV